MCKGGGGGPAWKPKAFKRLEKKKERKEKKNKKKREKAREDLALG